MSKLIVIDGTDGSGKATQTKLLVEALRKDGQTVATFAFPEYEVTTIGSVIGRALKGEFGNFLKISPYITAWMYTVGNAAARDRIIRRLRKGVVVCDRYETSNLAHQTAKLPKDEWDNFIALLEKVAFEELNMPRPNLVIYLYVPVEIARKLIKQKGKRIYLGKSQISDQHEQSLAYQERAAQVYSKLASERSEWHLLNCMRGKNLMTPEEIHAKILTLAKKIL